MAVLCTRAKKLILELANSSWLPPYDEDGVTAVLQEIQSFNLEINDTMSSKKDEELPVEIRIGLTMHYTALLRNKRCLLSYARYRADKVTSLRWETGPIISHDKTINLNTSERDYFNKYDRILTNYHQEFGLDLTTDLDPPRELYVEVRSLVNKTEIFTDSGLLKLNKGATYVLRQCDVDNLLKQGLIELSDHGFT